MPRKLLTMRPQRSAAARTFSARSLVCGSGANSCSSVDWATTTASGLLSSCDTPASSEPIAAIFSFWCSFSRWRLISSSARCFSRRSRIEPRKSRRSASRISLAVSSIGMISPADVLGHRLQPVADHRRAASGHVFGAVGIALAVVGGDHRIEQVLAEDVLARPAEHLLGGRVELDDRAGLVDHHDGVERRLQHGAADDFADMVFRQRPLDGVAERRAR